MARVNKVMGKKGQGSQRSRVKKVMGQKGYRSNGDRLKIPWVIEFKGQMSKFPSSLQPWLEVLLWKFRFGYNGQCATVVRSSIIIGKVWSDYKAVLITPVDQGVIFPGKVGRIFPGSITHFTVFSGQRLHQKEYHSTRMILLWKEEMCVHKM